MAGPVVSVRVTDVVMMMVVVVTVFDFAILLAASRLRYESHKGFGCHVVGLTDSVGFDLDRTVVEYLDSHLVLVHRSISERR
jgi:hypothetical protein